MCSYCLTAQGRDCDPLHVCSSCRRSQWWWAAMDSPWAITSKKARAKQRAADDDADGADAGRSIIADSPWAITKKPKKPVRDRATARPRARRYGRSARGQPQPAPRSTTRPRLRTDTRSPRTGRPRRSHPPQQKQAAEGGGRCGGQALEQAQGARARARAGARVGRKKGEARRGGARACAQRVCVHTRCAYTCTRTPPSAGVCVRWCLLPHRALARTGACSCALMQTHQQHARVNAPNSPASPPARSTHACTHTHTRTHTHTLAQRQDDSILSTHVRTVHTCFYFFFIQYPRSLSPHMFLFFI